MEFRYKKLFLTQTIVKEFDFPISSIVEFENCVVVLLDRDFYKKNNENVFCLSKDGKLVWQVPRFDYSCERSPFVDICKDSDNVRLWNWDSSFIIVEPDSGKIITTPFESRKGRRPW